MMDNGYEMIKWNIWIEYLTRRALPSKAVHLHWRRELSQKICDQDQIIVRLPVVSSSLLPSCKRKSTKSADNGNIEAEVIEPACVEHLIYANSRIEYPNDEGYGSDPSMPDTQEEPGPLVIGCNDSSWQARAQ